MKSKTDRSKLVLIFLEWFVDNLVLLLTLGAAIFVIFRRDLSSGEARIEQLLTGILWVLGLIATSEIIERYRKLNKIHRAVDRSLSFLESRFTDRPSAMAFFQKNPSLDVYIKNADQIDVCGVSLTSTITKQFGNLRERLQAGAKIRVLLIDPDSIAIQMTAERSMNPKDLDYYRLHIQSTMRELAYLQQSVEEFKRLGETSAKGGSFSVRLRSYAPSFGIDSFDANRHDGVLFVELYPHKFGYKTPPMFELLPQRDGDWYKYFTEQFDQMWEAARLWDPKKYLAQIPTPDNT